jgi:hypothetical protein
MLVVRDKLEAYLPSESRSLRVGKETSAFLSTLDQRLSTPESFLGGKIYPAMFEIKGEILEPILGLQIRRLSCASKWQALIGSQTLPRRSFRRLPKGNGRST